MCAACLVAAVGCGSGAPSGKVSGTVTYKNQPVTQGEASFYLKEKGVAATAKLDTAGKYVFDKPLAEGTCAVSVLPAPPEAAQPGTAPNASPKKYQDATSSGLSYTVKGGDNSYPIEMKD